MRQGKVKNRTVPAHICFWCCFQSEIRSTSSSSGTDFRVSWVEAGRFLFSLKDSMVVSFNCFLWSGFEDHGSHPFKEKKDLDFQTTCEWLWESLYLQLVENFSQGVPSVKRGTRNGQFLLQWDHHFGGGQLCGQIHSLCSESELNAVPFSNIEWSFLCVGLGSQLDCRFLGCRGCVLVLLLCQAQVACASPLTA